MPALWGCIIVAGFPNTALQPGHAAKPLSYTHRLVLYGETAVPGTQKPEAASGASLALGCCTHHHRHASCSNTDYAHIVLLHHCTCGPHHVYSQTPRILHSQILPSVARRCLPGTTWARSSDVSEKALAMWSLRGLCQGVPYPVSQYAIHAIQCLPHPVGDLAIDEGEC